MNPDEKETRSLAAALYAYFLLVAATGAFIVGILNLPWIPFYSKLFCISGLLTIVSIFFYGEYHRWDARSREGSRPKTDE